jgi:hypothetical protein
MPLSRVYVCRERAKAARMHAHDPHMWGAQIGGRPSRRTWERMGGALLHASPFFRMTAGAKGAREKYLA